MRRLSNLTLVGVQERVRRITELKDTMSDVLIKQAHSDENYLAWDVIRWISQGNASDSVAMTQELMACRSGKYKAPKGEGQ